MVARHQQRAAGKGVKILDLDHYPGDPSAQARRLPGATALELWVRDF